MHKPSDFNHWTYWARYEWHEWNPYALYRKVSWFARNVWAYREVLWHDQDCDYAYLLRLMQLKLRRMGQHFADHDIVESSPRMARECRIAAELCRRIDEDNYFVGKITRENAIKALGQREADLRYLSHLIQRKLLYWWD